jgi:drug/metabolite transporter (DMT)-like permease
VPGGHPGQWDAATPVQRGPLGPCQKSIAPSTLLLVADSPAARPARTASAVHGRTAALVLLALLSLVWGVHWVVVKVGLHDMPPLTYGAFRMLGGLLTMVAILGFQRRIRLPPHEDLPIVFSVSLLQISAGVLIMNFALQAVPAGRSSVLLYAMPLWVAVILWLMFRQPPLRNELLGLVLGIGGILVLVNPTVIDWGNPGELQGTLALIGNGILWAIVTIHIRRHTWVSTPLDLQPWMLLVASVPIVGAALLLEQGRSINWGTPLILALLYSGPLATAFANWASQSITRSLGPIASAMGFLATPVVGLVSGAVFLHEQLGLADIAGFAMVLAGIAAASLFTPPAARKTPIAASAAGDARA